MTFRHDILGQVLRRDEADSDTTKGDPHALSYRFDGREIGTIGNDSKVDATYLDSVETRGDAPGTGAFRGGAATGVGYARFGQGFDSVSSYEQGADGGRYTVNAGDTLSSIAMQLWGDASLWYKLAQANGLSADSVLVEGQALTVPGGVIRSANNASTIKPYDPSDAYGDTSPTTPKPIPPKVTAHKNKCGIFGQILSVVVAVAASYFLGPLVGNLVSQGFNNIIGTQSGFSFASLAMTVVTAGITQGLGGVNPLGASAGKLANDIARGALASTLSQGVGVVTGLQSRFDFAGVAAAGVVSGVGGAVSRGLNSPKGLFGIKAAPNSFASAAISGTASDIAAAATRSLVTGTDFGDNVLSVLPDVIGSVLGRGLTSMVGGNRLIGGPAETSGKRSMIRSILDIVNAPVDWIAGATNAVVTRPLVRTQGGRVGPAVPIRSLAQAAHLLGVVTSASDPYSYSRDGEDIVITAKRRSGSGLSFDPLSWWRGLPSGNEVLHGATEFAKGFGTSFVDLARGVGSTINYIRTTESREVARSAFWNTATGVDSILSDHTSFTDRFNSIRNASAYDYGHFTGNVVTAGVTLIAPELIAGRVTALRGLLAAERGFVPIAEGNSYLGTVEQLPRATRSMYIGDDMPIIGDVSSLADRFGWEREISITQGPGGNGYYLHSAPYDEFGNAVTHLPDDHYLLYHTHRELNYASQFDLDYLKTTGQPSSVIVHRTEGSFVFTPTQPRVNMPNIGGK